MGIFSRCDNCGRLSFFSTCLKCEADAANRGYGNSYPVPEKPATDFDKEGYDKEGYDKEGYDKYGYNRNGFDKDGKPAPAAGVESFKKFSENPIIRGTSFKFEEIKAFVTAESRSLSYLDDREFTIISVERKDHDENKGIKITTKEEFDIQGEKGNKFHTTRQAIVRKFLNDTGEPTELFNAINQPDNSLKVKIFMRKSASDEDYFDLDQC